MNAAMTLENLGLQHDNKQLNALIKEYEQTLETLMSESTARLVACRMIEFYLIQARFAIAL